MTSPIESLVAGLAIVLASAVCIPKVLADEPSESNLNNTETIPEAIDRAATQSSLFAEDNFFKDRSIAGDAAFTFGISYDENKLAKEARQLGAISQDLLNQQSSQDPIIRTQDLPNPYSASLLNDTELTDIQAEPSGIEQPTRVNPTDTEEPTEGESENLEEPTEAEPENTETEPNNTEEPSESEPNNTETEPNNTEEPSESEPENTETEPNNTEEPSESEP